MTSAPPEAPSPPVALGCVFMAAIALVVVGIGLFAVVFLESGADDGKLTLELADAYLPGEAVFIGDRNVFLVRLPSEDFVALRDVDAPNRAAGGRCRVALTSINDRSLPLEPAALRSRFSPEAASSQLVFREPCNDAIYDASGTVLTDDGPNLDRHPVTLDDSGRIVIDLTERTCTTRTERQLASPTAC